MIEILGWMSTIIVLAGFIFNAKGKYTKSVCTLKKKHPHHLHCSVKSCTKVTRLTHPAYDKEWKDKYNDKKMISDLLTAKKAQEKREE